MIVCKAKLGTYLSIAVFEAVAGGLAVYIYYQLPHLGSWTWLGRVLIPVLVGMMLAIAIKVVWSLKTVKVGRGRFEVSFPARRKRLLYSSKNLRYWKEETIKTLGGAYKEVVLQFDDGKKVSLSRQEHTNYSQLLKYMNQKFSKAKV